LAVLIILRKFEKHLGKDIGRGYEVKPSDSDKEV